MDEQIEKLQSLLLQCLPKALHDLISKEHLYKLSSIILDFHNNGVPKTFPKPHFEVECTPPLEESFVYFREAIKVSNETDFAIKDKNIAIFQKSLADIPLENLLILLGQRLTPASITDKTAIPPLQETLMKSAFEQGKQNLSVAARAWTKHVGRVNDCFWGEVRGSAHDKNQKSREIILSILENTTWWNIFFHYKHELVYEARIESGHGVRWGKKGEIFIGFLEPFLD